MLSLIVKISLLCGLGIGIPCSIGIHLERKDFNKGNCPICNHRMKLFDYDSQGGRGYCCHKCGYYTWVSYGCVDKHF